MAEVLTHNQQYSSPKEATEALAHHGVKGMKWGVRKADTRAGDPVALAYVAVIGGILIAKARMEYNDSGKKEAKVLLKQEKKTGIKHEWKKNDSLKGPKTHEEIMRDVVPSINKGFPQERGTSMNCRRCTFAYEMRRRGNDVKATRSIMAAGQDDAGLIKATSLKGADKSIDGRHPLESGWGQNAIHSSRQGMSMTAEAKAQNIFDRLTKEPDGSRGELAFSWAFGGGHSIAYEVINKKPVIFDTQANKSWADTASFAKDVTPIMGEAAFTRLDNAKLNNDFMKRWVADA